MSMLRSEHWARAVPLAVAICVSSACGDDADGAPASDGSTAAAADGGDDDAGQEPDGGGKRTTGPQRRTQDSRRFTLDESMLAFEPMPDADGWSGVLGESGYRIEVPKNWNGMLVMYAHGYAGTGEALRVTMPSIRKYLVEHGYAWAASTYSRNYYDVRAGVEDTNHLALEFTNLARKPGRTLLLPTKRYLIGHSMGGHVAGAAIEREAVNTAVHRVRYDGAVPMCGVMGDTALFSYFAAFQWAAQKLAGVPYTTEPVADIEAVRAQMRAALFTTYPTAATEAGLRLKDLVRNLSGGARSNYDQGFATKSLQDAVWNTIGGDGTVNGILALPVTDTREIIYQFDDDPSVSAEERTFNDEIQRSTPKSEANTLRADGLRWVPQVNGEFEIPVVSMHTLGDLYVPFKMQQLYRERAIANGSEQRLVQRAIRGTGHCEFTQAEQIAAFEALVKWEQEGTKPEGDEVLDPAVVSSPTYGCKFTQNTYTAEEMAGTLPVARSAVPACPE